MIYWGKARVREKGSRSEEWGEQLQGGALLSWYHIQEYSIGLIRGPFQKSHKEPQHLQTIHQGKVKEAIYLCVPSLVLSLHWQESFPMG